MRRHIRSLIQPGQRCGTAGQPGRGQVHGVRAQQAPQVRHQQAGQAGGRQQASECCAQRLDARQHAGAQRAKLAVVAALVLQQRRQQADVARQVIAMEQGGQRLLQRAWPAAGAALRQQREAGGEVGFGARQQRAQQLGAGMEMPIDGPARHADGASHVVHGDAMQAAVPDQLQRAGQDARPRDGGILAGVAGHGRGRPTGNARRPAPSGRACCGCGHPRRTS